MAGEWALHGRDVVYSASESHGPLALAATSGISLCAVTTLLVAILITGFKTKHQFARSQVGVYFLSLVLSDLLQATGSIMNAKWVVIEGVSTGPFCTAQAALKQTGNVGTALWSLVIAVHTFTLLFLRLRIGTTLFRCIFVGVWVFIGFVVMMGPVILQKTSQGPFWGISGYWCWITDAYHIEQFTDEYLFMFITAFVSFLLYSLIFFRLRGNLQGSGWDLRWRRVREPWAENIQDESQMSVIGKQMLWYPVAYTIIILPIAACRWSIIFGHKVPYGLTMAADSIFMLSGLVNAILYSTTRKIVSVHAPLPFSHLVCIKHPCRTRLSNTMSSKASLSDVQFSAPTPSYAKGVLNPSVTHPTVPVELWQPRRASDPPDYVRRELMKGVSPPWERTPSSVGKPGDSKYVSGNGVVSYGARELLTADGSSVTPHLRGSVKSPEEAHVSPARPNVDVPHAIVNTAAGDTPPHAIPPSPSSLPTTSGPPSLHRKRFSGWSFPSLREDTPHADEDVESVHTMLEEMRFASPSPAPERVVRKSPSSLRSASMSDLPRWPPRHHPFD